MGADDLPAATREQPPRDDEDAEEGELSEEEGQLPLGPEYGHGDDRLGRDGGRGRYGNDRSPGRRRSRSRSPRDARRRRSRSRSRSRGRGRRDRSRSPGRRDRRRYSRSRSRSRDRRRDRDGDPYRRSEHENDARDRQQQQKQDEEGEEDVEAFQARVEATLAAQEEDEERLIEERRRRRQEILAKYRSNQQQQQQQQGGDNGGASSEARPNTAAQPEEPEGADAVDEVDEEGMVAQLGVEEGGAVDIWRHGGGAPPAAGPSSASAAPSGLGEADDAELGRRLAAAAAAQHADATLAAADAAPADAAVNAEASPGDDDLDDMFAETPEDVRKAEQARGPAAAAPAGRRRGLVDAFDDADGYYNFQVGELIGGRYEVFKAHGRGVFSSVLRARDLGPTGTADAASAPEVAIKVIRSNETMTKAGQIEKVILRKLAEADPEGKRHCVRLLGSFEYRHHLCLVFEPMDMDLRALTKRYGRGIGLSLSAVRVYAQQMLVALHHLRACGVLHADIKPDNLLVNDRRTVVKLCDFGSAMFAGDNEITPYLVSRFYRAPEVILGLPYGHAMDMWAVGCVVYELFTGQILFAGRTNNEMLKLMMDVKGPFPKRLLRRGEFAVRHFDLADPNLTFALLEEDPVSKRPLRRLIPNPQVKADFSGLLSGMDPDRRALAALADLLERMMALDPDKRITPKEALRHPFIRGEAEAARARVPAVAPRAVVRQQQ